MTRWRAVAALRRLVNEDKNPARSDKEYVAPTALGYKRTTETRL